MPRIIRGEFGDDFVRVRNSLIPGAKRLIEADRAAFAKAGSALDAAYPLAEERRRLRQRTEEYRMRRLGQPTTEVRPSVEKSNVSGRASPFIYHIVEANWGDELRGARLHRAILDFIASNRKGELLRALGENLPRGQRESNARRAIVLGLAAVDPDSDEYLGGLTNLAKAPWIAPAGAKPGVRQVGPLPRVLRATGACVPGSAPGGDRRVQRFAASRRPIAGARSTRHPRGGRRVADRVIP